MKRLILILLLLLHLLPLAARVSARTDYGLRVGSSTVELIGDSLSVELHIDISQVEVRSGTSYSFTPFLRGSGKRVELPPVVVSGARRARFDRRERTLSPEQAGAKPYITVIDKGKSRPKELYYHVRVPYTPWMGSAQLALMCESKECCDFDFLGVDTLMTDLAIHVPIHRTQTISPEFTPCAECNERVSFLRPQTDGNGKQRQQSTTLYIDYPLNVHDVRPDFGRNPVELQKLDSLFRPLMDGGLVTMKSIRLCGYASPEGAYYDNERLASNRAQRFSTYMNQIYGIPSSRFNISCVAEDWETLAQLVADRRPEHYEQSLRIIAGVPIFEGRERELMNLANGEPYRWMLQNLFPLLRRMELTVDYAVREVNREEAVTLIYKHPQLLSLQEMYQVGKLYRPGTEQYREVYEIAATYFPDDVISNVNTASAILMAGDMSTARRYLNKVKDDPRAWNNLGVLAMVEGNLPEAIEWFHKAAVIDPKAGGNLADVVQLLKEKQKEKEQENGERK